MTEIIRYVIYLCYIITYFYLFSVRRAGKAACVNCRGPPNYTRCINVLNKNTQDERDCPRDGADTVSKIVHLKVK